jgi:hypothetical protein
MCFGDLLKRLAAGDDGFAANCSAKYWALEVKSTDYLPDARAQTYSAPTFQTFA